MNETASDERQPRRRRDLCAAAGRVVAEAELAAGQAAPSAAAPPSVPALKRAFLRCDRASSQSGLTLAAAAGRGEVGAGLLRREFEGDPGRLLGWWRSARQAPLPESGRASS